MSDPTPPSRTCRVCGCTEERACTGADGQPCHWVMDDLCSTCAEQMDFAHPTAHALRPVRVVGDAFREYEATTFPQGPWAGCELYLRRCAAVGYLKDDGSRIVLDILDANGDIVQDFPLTRKGLRYLRSQLRFKVVEAMRI